MKKTMLLGFAASMAMIGLAKADPVPLSAYADANGFIDVQALTCGQLANTYQEDANALSSWYSGWYNGLAHKHYADFKKGREVEHQVIEYCKGPPDERIIHAIGVMLREDRAERMMMEKGGGLHEKSASDDGALRRGAILSGASGNRPANAGAANRDLSVRRAGRTCVPVRGANRGVANRICVALGRAKGGAGNHAARR